MKRTLALLVSIALGMSLAPNVASAETTTVDTPSVALAADATLPTLAAAKKKKKTCKVMCIQSSFATTGLAEYFVNNNSDLLTINDDTIELRDLDTRRTEDSLNFPANVALGSFGMTTISDDGDEVYLVANHASTGAKIYRVNTSTGVLSLTNVTPVSPTYEVWAPSAKDIVAAPDGSGFFMLFQVSNNSYICKFTSTGVEDYCSTSFGGASETSGLFFGYNNALLVVWGDTDKRWTFSATDLSKTTDTVVGLAGRDLDFAHGLRFSDGDVVFADYVQAGTASPATTTLYQLTIDGTLRGSQTISGGVTFSDAAGPSADPYFGYFLGTPLSSAGNPLEHSVLYQIQNYSLQSQLKVRKTLKIKPNRDFYVPQYITTDSQGRYVLAYSENMSTTSVIPVHPDFPIKITMDSEYTTCPAVGYDITWDFLNLQKGKSVTSYTVYFKPISGGKFRTIDTILADGTRTYFYPYTGTPGYVRILPTKIKVNSYSGGITADGESSRSLPFHRQYGC